MKVPKSFMLFATKINVEFDNKKCNDMERYGEASYSQSKIILSNTHGLDTLSDGKIADTYYHEKVHLILSTMNELDLNNNEKFVDIFAKLLRQSDETVIY